MRFRYLGVALAALALSASACDDDDENGPDNEVEVSAMIIDAGTQSVSVSETGVVTGGPFVFALGDRAVTVSFRDENGDLIDEDDLVGYIAEATTNDADVVSVSPTGDFTFKSGVEAADRLLAAKANVTALACANDDMAAGAMLALHRAGLEIPADISVTGFDDTPMSEVIWPPLTTLRQPIKLLAERAVHMLVDGAGSTAEPTHELIAHQLVVRESTSCVR